MPLQNAVLSYLSGEQRSSRALQPSKLRHIRPARKFLGCIRPHCTQAMDTRMDVKNTVATSDPGNDGFRTRVANWPAAFFLDFKLDDTITKGQKWLRWGMLLVVVFIVFLLVGLSPTWRAPYRTQRMSFQQLQGEMSSNPNVYRANTTTINCPCNNKNGLVYSDFLNFSRATFLGSYGPQERLECNFTSFKLYGKQKLDELNYIEYSREQPCTTPVQAKRVCPVNQALWNDDYCSVICEQANRRCTYCDDDIFFKMCRTALLSVAKGFAKAYSGEQWQEQDQLQSGLARSLKDNLIQSMWQGYQGLTAMNAISAAKELKAEPGETVDVLVSYQMLLSYAASVNILESELSDNHTAMSIIKEWIYIRYPEYLKACNPTACDVTVETNWYYKSIAFLSDLGGVWQIAFIVAAIAWGATKFLWGSDMIRGTKQPTVV